MISEWPAKCCLIIFFPLHANIEHTPGPGHAMVTKQSQSNFCTSHRLVSNLRLSTGSTSLYKVQAKDHHLWVNTFLTIDCVDSYLFVLNMNMLQKSKCIILFMKLTNGQKQIWILFCNLYNKLVGRMINVSTDCQT